MKVTIVGQIDQIGKKQEISEKFSKTELIIKTVEQFPNYYKIEFQNGNAEILKNWDEGSNVKINCNLRGRLYEKQDGGIEVFQSLVGWKIESA